MSLHYIKAFFSIVTATCGSGPHSLLVSDLTPSASQHSSTIAWAIYFYSVKAFTLWSLPRSCEQHWVPSFPAIDPTSSINLFRTVPPTSNISLFTASHCKSSSSFCVYVGVGCWGEEWGVCLVWSCVGKDKGGVMFSLSIVYETGRKSVLNNKWEQVWLSSPLLWSWRRPLESRLAWEEQRADRSRV